MYLSNGTGDDTIVVGTTAAVGTSVGLDSIQVVKVNGQEGPNTLIVENRSAATKNLTLKNLSATPARAAIIRNNNKTVNFENVKPTEIRTPGGTPT